jgi:hypothetical protein
MPEGFIARLARGFGYAVKGGNAATDAGSWFGPQKPLDPIAPPNVAGRQFDYPFGFNQAISPRNREPTGFNELRGLADSYDLLRCVIETRKDQMERLAWRIRSRDGNAQRGVARDPRIAAITAFFARPDRIHSWNSWLRMLLEDLLVIDAPTLYLRRTRGGALWALEPLDGGTIKRLIDDWGRTPAPPAPAYQQILKGVPAVDYTADELLYAPRNVRAHKAYGYSPVEQVQMSVNIALRRQIYQLQYYTEGNIPEALIGVPDNWNPDQIRQFQAYWDTLNSGDTAERRHAKFVPGGVAKTFIPTREPVMKDVFDEWLARVICFAFSIPPSAFTAQVNRATAETAQETSLSEGLVPLQNWVKQLVDQVIAAEFAAPDLEFAWADERAINPGDVAQIATSYVAAGIKSVNEVRAELGLPPVQGGDLPAGQKSASEQSPTSDNSETLQRLNTNHFGPGERGGQFAPRDSGNNDGFLVPTGGPNPAKLIPPLMNAVKRWLQRMPKPSEKPSELPGEGAREQPSQPSAEGGAEKPSLPPAKGMTEELSAPPMEGESKSPPPDEQFNLPAEKPTERSGVYHEGREIADNIKEALQNDWHQVVQHIGQVVDGVDWISNQVPNIVADVDFSQAAPYDLPDLVEAAKGDSEAGYQDHHIVEQGPQNDDLSPEEKPRIQESSNIARIPYYVHQEITNYYRSPIKGPPFNGMTPREYLRGKSFDERYQFGLDVLRGRGIIK